MPSRAASGYGTVDQPPHARVSAARLRLRLLAVLTVLTIVAPASNELTAQQGRTQTVSDSLDPAHVALMRYNGFVIAMNADSIAACFRPDGEMQDAGSPPIVGPSAIRAHLQSFAAYHVLENRLTVDSSRMFGDTVTERGAFWQRVRLPSGDTVVAQGRFDARWIRDSPGHWRLRRLATAPPR